jgi:hypothetical protein
MSPFPLVINYSSIFLLGVFIYSYFQVIFPDIKAVHHVNEPYESSQRLDYIGHCISNIFKSIPLPHCELPNGSFESPQALSFSHVIVCCIRSLVLLVSYYIRNFKS